MKKVLSLVLALVMVLGMIPTFAADATGAQALYDNGFITGKDGADLEAKLDVNAQLTRAQLAALIAELNGAKEEAAAFEQPADFTDFSMIAGWAKNFVSYAAVNGWMNGFTDGTFRAGASVPAQQLAAVLMNALGYDVVWNTVLADAAKLGIVVEGAALTRGEAFEAMWVAVSEVKMADKDMTLGQFLGKLTPPVVVPKALMASKVTASNLKTMVVEFNMAVDKDSITATTVKAVKGTTDVVASRMLSEDGKTLTIVYNTAAVTQSSDVKLTINGVKSLDGTLKIVDYTVTNTVTDVAIPVITGAAALNGKQIEVFFSEPMNTEALSSIAFQVINDVKINDLAVIAKVTPNFAKNSAVYELSTILAAGKHTIKLANIADYAGYKALAASFDVTVVADTAAPVVTGAVVKNINTVEVTFNESLSAVGSFWVDGGVATPVVVANSNNTKYTLTFTTALDLSAIVQVKVEYQSQKDVVGNTVSTKTAFTFNVADDTTLPTVAVVVGTANKLTLTFSKPMLTTVGTIQVMDKDQVAFGSLLNVSALTFKSGSNNTVLELTGTQVGLNSVNAGTYFVNIKAMKDATVRANLLPAQMLEIAALDSKVPTVTSSYTVKAGTLTGTDLKSDDTITFYFSEAMDEATVKNLSNFVRNTGSVAFSATTGVSFKSIAADGKSATFTYPAARDLVLGDLFTVYALKDIAGNMVTTNAAINKLATAFTVPSLATLTATDKVVVTFATPVASIDPSFLTVLKGTEAYAVPVSATIGTGVNNNKVTFTLNKALDTFTTGYSVVQNNVTLATDVYGQSLATGTVFTLAAGTFVDAVKPVIDTVKVGTTNNQIVLTFSEPVTPVAASLPLDLVLTNLTEEEVIPFTGYTVAATTLTTVTITIIDASVSADKVSVALINGRFITDGIVTNTAVPFTAMNVKDGTNDAIMNSSVMVAAIAAVVAYEALPLTTVGEVAAAVTNAGTVATTAIATAVTAVAPTADTTALTARVTAKTALVTAEAAKVTALSTAITAQTTALAALTVDDTAPLATGTITTANKTAYQTILTNAATTLAAPVTTIAVIVTTTATVNAGPTLN